MLTVLVLGKNADSSQTFFLVVTDQRAMLNKSLVSPSGMVTCVRRWHGSLVNLLWVLKPLFEQGFFNA